MRDIEYAQRIITTADEYHFTAESEWEHAVALDPTEGASFEEFQLSIRTALHFYARSYLILEMIETSEDQSLEDLIEIITDEDEEFNDFVIKNKAAEILFGEEENDFTRLFAVAEAIRSYLMGRSAEMAATLHKRFVDSDE